MMKTKVFILCFTMLIFGQIIFGQEKGVGNRIVSKLPAKEKRWALIIGVSQYEDENITLLPGANNDARGLRDALRDYAGFDEKQIILLTTDESKDRQPTKNNILRYLGNLNGTVPKDGLLLVAFSGHGIERQKQAFLLASDTPYNDNVKVLERTAISVSNDFKELVRDTGVGQVILLLDACRNDPSSGRSSSDNPLTEAYKEGFSFDVRNREVEAFATLYATSIGERAYEYTRENKGYFTWAFIEGLKGGAANENGEVTLGNLIRYVEKYVPQQVKIDLGSNKLQRPFSIVEGYKAEELVLGITKIQRLQTNKKVDEEIFWEAIKNSTDIEDFRLYKEKYPNGIYTNFADLRIQQLTLYANKTEVTTYNPANKIAESWLIYSKIAKKLLRYNLINSFSEGLAVVNTESKYGLAGNDRFGFIDKSGIKVIDLKYNDARSFSEGLAAVEAKDKYGFIDKAGREVIAFKYSYAYSFYEGLAAVQLNGKYGFIDKTGREVIPFKYDYTLGFSEGLAATKLNSKYGFIDRTGREAIPPKYDRVYSLSEGLIPVEIDGKWGYIDKYDRQIIAPRYIYATSFSEGLAVVIRAGNLFGKYGYIGKNGGEVIAPKYDTAASFSDGLAQVGINNKVGFIDKTERVIIPLKYDGVWFDGFRKEGFIGIILNGKKGFVDIYGNEYFDF